MSWESWIERESLNVYEYKLNEAIDFFELDKKDNRQSVKDNLHYLINWWYTNRTRFDKTKTIQDIANKLKVHYTLILHYKLRRKKSIKFLVNIKELFQFLNGDISAEYEKTFVIGDKYKNLRDKYKNLRDKYKDLRNKSKVDMLIIQCIQQFDLSRKSRAAKLKDQVHYLILFCKENELLINEFNSLSKTGKYLGKTHSTIHHYQKVRRKGRMFDENTQDVFDFLNEGLSKIVFE